MRLGTFVMGAADVEETVRRIEVAERLGYDGALVTQVNGHEATTIMAAAAARTDRIEIGSGVIPIYMRTPTTMAQTAATLWELSGGRSFLGLGLGHRVVMERWHGEAIRRPVAEMREYVSIVRAVLAGDPPVRTEKWASDMPLVQGRGATPPLLIGALSPGMLRLAGEIADGVVVWLATPDYLRDVVLPCVREGLHRAGRSSEGFRVVASIPCAVTDDIVELRRACVRRISHNLRLPFYRAMLERGGYHDDLTRIAEVERYEQLGAPVPPAALDALANGAIIRNVAAIGSRSVVAAKLAEYAASGVTYAGINPIRTDDFYRTLREVVLAGGRDALGSDPRRGKGSEPASGASHPLKTGMQHG